MTLFFISPASPEEVYKSVEELLVTKFPGPEELLVNKFGVPTKILKLAKDSISGPLSELIYNSFLNGIFPNVFQIVQVVPVFKLESRKLILLEY